MQARDPIPSIAPAPQNTSASRTHASKDEAETEADATAARVLLVQGDELQSSRPQWWHQEVYFLCRHQRWAD